MRCPQTPVFTGLQAKGARAVSGRLLVGTEPHDRLPAYPLGNRNFYGTAADGAIAHEFLGKPSGEIDFHPLPFAAIGARRGHVLELFHDGAI
jgi:hypothetical protein